MNAEMFGILYDTTIAVVQEPGENWVPLQSLQQFVQAEREGLGGDVDDMLGRHGCFLGVGFHHCWAHLDAKALRRPLFGN